MTLTSLLPTLRHSIPSPFTRDLWPVGAVPTLDDVVVAGVSVLRYVELCGTPSVMTGAAVIPLSGGMPSTSESATVLAVSVVDVIGTDAANARLVGPEPVIVVDAVLATAQPRWGEARLIGRVSDARDRRHVVRDAAGSAVPGVALVLPADLIPGDLIAVPCVGAVPVGDVRVRNAEIQAEVA
ncbi:hypothetical protein [Microbacterium sp. NPDC056057]|uniref:hypothetical protein n=1 Tax=Microbacterium sp. NPDC056057 TaxID=3345699 RepID=UPI0035E0F990